MEDTEITDAEVDALVERAKSELDRCLAVSKMTGRPCPARPKPGTGFCGRHTPGYAEACAARTRSRQARLQADEAEQRKLWEELRPAIEESAESFGADDELKLACSVLVCGLCCRCSTYRVAKILEVPATRISGIAAWLRAYGIWTPDGGVRSFAECKECPDLPLWMDAMVGTGILARADDGETYSSINVREIPPCTGSTRT